MMNDIEYKAYMFASAAHGAIGQLRKYTNEPYISHCVEVASIFKTYRCWATPEEVAVAYLHDVLEDTFVKDSEILLFFGEEILEGVKLLTNTSKSTGLNRAQRHRIDIDRLSKAPPYVQTIKYADMYHNCLSIKQYDPRFAKQYFKEKRELIHEMNKVPQSLYNKVYELIKEE